MNHNKLATYAVYAYLATTSFLGYRAICYNKELTNLCNDASAKIEILPKFSRSIEDNLIGERQEYIHILERITRKNKLDKFEKNELESIILEMNNVDTKIRRYGFFAAFLFCFAPINSVLIYDSMKSKLQSNAKYGELK